MAKDPAFLFYSNDFLSGTFTMSDEQVGKYVRLLCLQHQKKELTENDMLNICKSYDEDVYSKFIKTKRNTFYNKRLADEMDRRKKYSDSRRKNRLSKNICKSYVEHMETETGTIILLKDIIEYVKEKGLNIDAEYYYNSRMENDWVKKSGDKVKNWKLDIQNAARSGKWPIAKEENGQINLNKMLLG